MKRVAEKLPKHSMQDAAAALKKMAMQAGDKLWTLLYVLTDLCTANVNVLWQFCR